MKLPCSLENHFFVEKESLKMHVHESFFAASSKHICTLIECPHHSGNVAPTPFLCILFEIYVETYNQIKEIQKKWQKRCNNPRFAVSQFVTCPC